MERLQKVIAYAGVASRRKAEALILEGKVTVNGEVVKQLGVKVSANDQIEVEGVPLEKEKKVYHLFYKPRGVISSVSDNKGRETVTSYFEHVEQRLYPVGRLDYETSGIILMTNDGEFANLLMHPRYGVEKIYVAKVKPIPNEEQLNKLRNGVKIEGEMTSPADVKIISIDKNKQTAIVEVTIHEGRNRQVRKMFESVGCLVDKLKREKYAFLTLKGLNAGDSRVLTPHEVKQLRAIVENGK